MRARISILILCSFVFFKLAYSFDNKAIKGVIDLRGVNLEQSDPIKLEGEWAFYWKQLVLPTQLDAEANSNRQFVQVPASWSKYSDTEGRKLSADGYATYSLRILVDSSESVYALKLYSIFSASKIYVNGHLADSAGVMSKTKAGAKPAFKTIELPVTAIKDNISNDWHVDLTIQVSNFHHRRSGLQQPIFFGTSQSIIARTKNSLILSLLIIGIILIIGLNHTSMFLFNRQDKSNLIFGILSLVMILRDITTGERILLHWFPNFNWELLVKLDNFSGFATIALFSFFFYFHYQKAFPKVVFYIIAAAGIIITLLVFTTPAWFYGKFRMAFEIYIALGGMFLVFGVLLTATIKKFEGAALAFIGMFLLYSTAINDVLSSMGIIKTAYIAPFGLVSYMLIQSYLLSQKSGKALVQNQKLNDELLNEKQALEKHIEQRTIELQKQADELKAYHEKQEKQIWINQGLSEVADEIRKNRTDLNSVAVGLLTVVMRRVKAPVGAMYFKTTACAETDLQILANIGLDNENADLFIDQREGLIGKCFSTNQAINLDKVPDGFFRISSGLGKATPTSMLILPLIVDGKGIGVVEMASFKPFTSEQMDYIERAFDNIAAQLNIIQMNNNNQKLIEEYKLRENDFVNMEQELVHVKEELNILKSQ